MTHKHHGELNEHDVSFKRGHSFSCDYGEKGCVHEVVHANEQVMREAVHETRKMPRGL
jgi:hypothetical protein